MLKVKVMFYPGFREFLGGKEREVELLEKTDIEGLLGFLCYSDEQRYKIFDDSDNLKNYVNIILKNDHNIQSIRDVKTELKDGDSVIIFPAIGAG